MGALKYYLLRVEPKKRMLFNPAESIDFQGNTGVYLQYTHAKISAILRKAAAEGISYTPADYAEAGEPHERELNLIQTLLRYPAKLTEAAEHYSPAVIANFTYELARTYSSFYAELSIFGEQKSANRALRVALSAKTAELLKKLLALMGIEAPERM